MLLPTSYALTLALLALSVVCWGSWANTLKKSNWRFELYYLDFCLGALAAAVIIAFTVGSMGPDLSVQDSFLLVSKRPILLAFVAGCVFNLANMLLVASLEVAGMSVALPIGLGLSLIVGSIWSYISQSSGNALMVFGGSALVLTAVILSSVSSGLMQGIRRRAAIELAASQNPAPDPARTAAASRKKREAGNESGSLLGVWLAIAGGIVMGAYAPLTAMSMEGELGFTNPFAVTLLFCVGMLVSTFIYNLYFMNLPVKGQPISFFTYFTGRLSQHALGLLGGIIWLTGTAANFAAAAAQGSAKAGTSLSYTVAHSASVLALVWGVFVWKEYSNASGAITRLLLLQAVLLIAGIYLISKSGLA